MLGGVEFPLTEGRTLFCVGSEQSFASHQANALNGAEESLFIPAMTDGPNFSLEFGSPTSAGDFSLEIFSAAPRVESGQFQAVCRAGALWFAVKPAADLWSAAVLNFSDSAPNPTPRAKPAKRASSGLLRKSLLSLLLLTVLAVAGGYGWSYWRQMTNERQEQGLETLLQDPNHHYQVRFGRDRKFYVLAANEPDAAWARQSILHANYGKPVAVLTQDAERQRLEGWLEQRQPGFFTLNLVSVERPRLLLSLERASLTPEAKLRLQQDLLAQIPYAAKVELDWTSDSLVAADAQARLDKLALSYRRQGDPARALVYVLAGEIDDGSLGQLRGQITEFERTYGTRYVRFVLDLQEDWLKGKSFKYGADGYVQLSPTHWYFPKPLSNKD